MRKNKTAKDGLKGYFTKKGFILSFDLILGMTIVFIILFISVFFVSQGSAITISEHQLLRVGSDLVTIMDGKKTFDSFDYETIETEIEKVLPGNYEMLVRLQGNFSSGNGTVEVGGDIPQNRLTVTGRKAAVTDDNIYFKITYFIWIREQD